MKPRTNESHFRRIAAVTRPCACSSVFLDFYGVHQYMEKVEIAVMLCRRLSKDLIH